MNKFNIFDILGIDPKAGYDLAQVVTALKMRRNQYATIPSKREQFVWLGTIIPQLEVNPNNVLKTHARNYADMLASRKKKEQTAIFNEARLFIVDGHIDSGILDRLEDKYQDFSRDELLAILGVKERVSGSGASPLDETTMRKIAEWLAVVNKKNLYDVLGLEYDASADDILSARKLLYGQWSVRAISDKKEAMINLLGYCTERQLGNQRWRTSYDAALFDPVRKAIELLSESSTPIITSFQHDAMLEQCAAAGIPAAVATDRIAATAADLNVALQLTPPKPEQKPKPDTKPDDNPSTSGTTSWKFPVMIVVILVILSVIVAVISNYDSKEPADSWEDADSAMVMAVEKAAAEVAEVAEVAEAVADSAAAAVAVPYEDYEEAAVNEAVEEPATEEVAVEDY